MSSLHPQLDAANVRSVAVGHEEVGVDDFVKGKFFDGEVYVDAKRETYNALGFKRFGFIAGIWQAFFSRKGKESTAEAKSAGVGGNLSEGDGFQGGGTLIVNTEGKVLLHFVQQELPDIVPLADVLKAVGIEAKPPTEEPKLPNAECDNECKTNL